MLMRANYVQSIERIRLQVVTSSTHSHNKSINTEFIKHENSIVWVNTAFALKCSLGDIVSDRHNLYMNKQFCPYKVFKFVWEVNSIQ